MGFLNKVKVVQYRFANYHTSSSTSSSDNDAAQSLGAVGGFPSAIIAFSASSCLASLHRPISRSRKAYTSEQMNSTLTW